MASPASEWYNTSMGKQAQDQNNQDGTIVAETRLMPIPGDDKDFLGTARVGWEGAESKSSGRTGCVWEHRVVHMT